MQPAAHQSNGREGETATFNVSETTLYERIHKELCLELEAFDIL
jgi:hypothetical protein